MAVIQITDVDRLKAWGPKTDGLDDEVLNRVINAATAAVETSTGRLIMSRAHTVVVDGSRAVGRTKEVLRLAHGPVESSAPAPVVTENGEALTVATGYDLDADVILDPGGSPSDKQGPPRVPRLIRQRRSAQLQSDVGANPNLGWKPGIQNITITYTAGYQITTGISTHGPEDIEQVVLALVWLMYKEGRRSGHQNVTRLNQATAYLKELPAGEQIILENWKRPPGINAA